MSFKRQGTPENLEPVMFKCPRCGKESITLINGICELCGLNDTNTEIKKTSKHKKHKKS
jgi:ribosomal protein L37E